MTSSGVRPKRASSIAFSARKRSVAPGSVVFTGTRTDVERCYAAADVVAFSSRWGEAMALTPLEAMASGRPVVATDVAGIRESLGDGCGAVVPPGDEAAFARELVTRLTDPALVEREGAAARAHAERSLDLRRVHGYLMNLIDGLTVQS